MRIISGKLKGRRFSAPTSLPVHPTTDQAKEALFNVLNHRFFFQDIRVLDLFFGLGGISYEFASRGVPSIHCVDIDHGCVRYVQETIRRFEISDQIQVSRSDVFKFLKRNFSAPYDFIFADPPYQMSDEHLKPLIDLCLQSEWIKSGGLMILEHSHRKTLIYDHPYYKKTKRYGQVCFSFFECFDQTDLPVYKTFDTK
ncbi:MAG: RsmD family RNA methyltransferase [Flavobacteriales bacterium Tduv]